MKNSTHWILLPFSLLYGLGIYLRNKLYDWGFFGQYYSNKAFTIVVGNLEVGGTGKTPMIEYLLHKIMQRGLKVAILSRGYGRKTKGFRIVELNSTVEEVGDEPLQFKKKFSEICVVVCENRSYGVQQLESDFDVILLDDAFQHRAFKPTFSILLFSYSSFFKPKFLLPAGRFRDLWKEKRRADIWVVTKTAEKLSENSIIKIQKQLGWNSKSKIPLFFSEIRYLEPISMQNKGEVLNFNHINSVLLLSGIANPKPLHDYLQSKNLEIFPMEYPDHYSFKQQDFLNIKRQFESIQDSQKVILTTEKDVQRISSLADSDFLKLPIYYLPIQNQFKNHDNAEIQFVDTLFKRLEKFRNI